MWNYLREQGMAELSAPSRVYLCVAGVLEKVGSPGQAVSAREVIEAGHGELMRRADKISDPEWRRSFLHDVPENRAIDEWRHRFLVGG